jgi:site-specific DNA-cytosine methylase
MASLLWALWINKGGRIMVLKVGSLFSGAGGFDLGFRQAGYEIVFALDNWQAACRTHNRNFPEIDQILMNLIRPSLSKIILMCC